MNLLPHSQSTICSYAPNLQYPKKHQKKNVKLKTEKNYYHVHFETEILLKINISMYIQNDWWSCKKLESLMFKCLLTELKNTLWYLTTLKKMGRPHILKQNCSWKLQLCLSMCNILIVWKKNYQNTISDNPFPSQCFNKPHVPQIWGDVHTGQLICKANKLIGSYMRHKNTDKMKLLWNIDSKGLSINITFNLSLYVEILFERGFYRDYQK